MIALDKERIIQGLASIYQNIEVFEEVDSTNIIIKQKDYFYPNSLVLSKYQSKGKGTQGRSFFCEKHKGIYATCVVDTEKSVHEPTLLPLVMGLSLVKILKNYNINSNVKWVNDVLINNKKVVGILCEQVVNQSLMIVGIGVNVYPMNFPEDIIHQVSTLQQHTQFELDINQIVIDLFIEFNKNLYVDSQQIIDEYCLYNELIDKEISFISNGKTLHGIVKTIDNIGALIISHNNKDHRIVSTNQIIDY